MIPKNELSAAELYEMSMKTLEAHLSLDIDGYRCSTEMVLSAVVKAALDVAELQQQEAEMNACLAVGLPAKLPRGGYGSGHRLP